MRLYQGEVFQYADSQLETHWTETPRVLQPVQNTRKWPLLLCLPYPLAHTDTSLATAAPHSKAVFTVSSGVRLTHAFLYSFHSCLQEGIGGGRRQQAAAAWEASLPRLFTGNPRPEERGQQTWPQQCPVLATNTHHARATKLLFNFSKNRDVRKHCQMVTTCNLLAICSASVLQARTRERHLAFMSTVSRLCRSAQ